MLLLLPPLPSGLGLGLLCLSRAAALGFNQSLWVYAAELLPTAVRASGTAACSKLPGQSATSPTLGGPEAVRLPPCTLEEGAAAARSSGRSSVEAGYATSTAEFHTPHKQFPPTLNPTHSSPLLLTTNRHRGRHVLRAPRRHRGCQHAHWSLARLARHNLGRMQCGLPAGRRDRPPGPAARHRGRVPARRCR